MCVLETQVSSLMARAFAFYAILLLQNMFYESDKKELKAEHPTVNKEDFFINMAFEFGLKSGEKLSE